MPRTAQPFTLSIAAPFALSAESSDGGPIRQSFQFAEIRRRSISPRDPGLIQPPRRADVRQKSSCRVSVVVETLVTKSRRAPIPKRRCSLISAKIANRLSALSGVRAHVPARACVFGRQRGFDALPFDTTTPVRGMVGVRAPRCRYLSRISATPSPGRTVDDDDDATARPGWTVIPRPPPKLQRPPAGVPWVHRRYQQAEQGYSSQLEQRISLRLTPSAVLEARP